MSDDLAAWWAEQCRARDARDFAAMFEGDCEHGVALMAWCDLCAKA